MTMTAEQLAQLREKARSASAGDWIKESGDGWEAVSSSDDHANGGFIIAHFEGPDAKANREFMQAATPNVVLALLDELEARTVTVKLPESVIDAICLTAAEIHNLGRGVSDERAQEIINSIRCAAGINLTVEG